MAFNVTRSSFQRCDYFFSPIFVCLFSQVSEGFSEKREIKERKKHVNMNIFILCVCRQFGHTRAYKKYCATKFIIVCLCHLQCDNFPWKAHWKQNKSILQRSCASAHTYTTNTFLLNHTRAGHNRGNMIVPNLQDVINIIICLQIPKFCGTKMRIVDFVFWFPRLFFWFWAG